MLQHLLNGLGPNWLESRLYADLARIPNRYAFVCQFLQMPKILIKMRKFATITRQLDAKR